MLLLKLKHGESMGWTTKTENQEGKKFPTPVPCN